MNLTLRQRDNLLPTHALSQERVSASTDLQPRQFLNFINDNDGTRIVLDKVLNDLLQASWIAGVRRKLAAFQ